MSTYRFAIPSLQLLPNVRLVLEHAVVAVVRREAAGVVLVQDLDLETLRLEPGEQILAGVVAGAERGAARLRGPFTAGAPPRVRAAGLLKVLVVVTRPVLAVDNPLRKTHHLFLRFPYVCPEPVLVE